MVSLGVRSSEDITATNLDANSSVGLISGLFDEVRMQGAA